MARYGPAPYMLADELEYLQAYEDVLEKYKVVYSGSLEFSREWELWTMIKLMFGGNIPGSDVQLRRVIQ
ncbi:hypothetical protein QQF64_006232 [Cirrhinus molitorella]|uniref:Uncharacterized protein n=1 Tax=Cirrhinus molitorella TaxID=172907 RepID=A0ABR3MIH0_9TELE